jgi:hypothetical protein
MNEQKWALEIKAVYHKLQFCNLQFTPVVLKITARRGDLLGQDNRI